MIGLGSSSTLGIGLVIELRDQFTQNANKIHKSMDLLQNGAKRSLNASFNQMIGIGGVMVAGGMGIVKGMMAASASAREFEAVLINIKAIGGMGDQDMMGLGKLAMVLGPKYAMSAKSVAEGMEDLVKAGLKANSIPKVMEALLATSVATGDKLEGETGVAARMTDMLMAWGFQAESAGHMGDILQKAANESTVSFGNLSESMKYSQDILKSLNFTFEESVAMMAVLGNSGIKASMAGTALGNAWREITVAAGGGSKKKSAALSLLGLNKGDLVSASGELKHPVEMLTLIRKGLEGLGGVQKQNALTDLFGLRGKRAIIPLLEALEKDPTGHKLGKSLTEMIDTLKNDSAGSNAAILAEKVKGAAFQTAQLAANWENFKIASGEAFKPLLNWALPKLNSMLKHLTSFAQNHPGIIKGIAIFGALLIPAGALLGIVGLLGRALTAGAVGFKVMGQAGKWVFSELIGRALTLLGIQRGIAATQGINSAGNLYNLATGRMVKGGFGIGASSGGGVLRSLLSQFGRFIPGMGGFGIGASSVGGVLGSLLLQFGRFIPVVGAVISVMGALKMVGISLKDQLMFVVGSFKWYVSTIMNAITSLIYMVLHPLDSFTVGTGFSERQEAIFNDSFGGTAWGKGGKHDLSGSDNPTLPNGYHPGTSQISNDKQTHIHIYVDGEKKISKLIKEGSEQAITSWYGLNQ